MSRVDEALRRAAETRQQASGGLESAAQPLPPITGEEVDGVSRDLFGVEMPERRPLRAVAALTASTAASPPPAPLPSELHTATTPAPPPAPREQSLFERIDANAAFKVVVDPNMTPAFRERYRQLAATLHHAQTSAGIKVVMIASAAVGEGKTLTATNLALTFSESYKRRVLLIDADLRRPSLHVMFGIDNSTGLSDGLSAAVERPVRLRQLTPRLAILPAGLPTGDPMAGLTSERMRRILEEAREAFDWIVVDTPPVGLMPDANLLAAMVDGAVVVVKAESTPHDLVQRAVDAIGRTKVFGAVLNRATAASRNVPYEYESYYLQPAATEAEQT